MDTYFKAEAKDRPTFDIICPNLKELNPCRRTENQRELQQDKREIKQHAINIKKQAVLTQNMVMDTGKKTLKMSAVHIIIISC